ncbi:MAG: DUF4276 family protein [Isosphaeraceae bacterium]
MARLYLFAEGQTEETFADTLLKGHLANHGVFLHRPTQIAHARRRGRAHRGGGRNYKPMRDDILRFTSQERAGDVFFTTMIDLYAIHPGFPKLGESEAFRHSPPQRVEFLERAFADDVGDARFIPYIQLHEYEAYLFSDPAWFSYFYDREKEIAALQAIANSHPTPELIDDWPNSAPSKRIIAQIPEYELAKSVVGPQVAVLIGLDVIRARCPHFHAWLSRLESLGT